MSANPVFTPTSDQSVIDEHGMSNADREAVCRVVDQAPALSPAQRERLAAVLGGGTSRRVPEPVAA